MPSESPREPSFLSRWLAERGGSTLSVYATSVAFCAYFCMYAFRKPFAAGTYEGSPVPIGDGIELKTLFVISQVIGYATSKYLGVKVCSEAGRRGRLPTLIGLICASELALVLFGMAPLDKPWLRAGALFLNGLPLGMVWGLVVLYLEGRRTSEFLMAGLSCAYIVSSGVVKDVGRAVLAGADFPMPTPESWGLVLPNPFPPMAEQWMPAVTGSLFFVPFVFFAWLLDQVPDPTKEDRSARVERKPMNGAARWAFFGRYAVPMVAALAVYFMLTAFRDYRDNYAVEVFDQLGYQYEDNKTIVSRGELLVALGVIVVLSQLCRVSDNRWGLTATYGVMSLGLATIGVATLLLDAGQISGFWWYTLIGLGGYLAYVPFNSMLFDRMIASTGFAGTAVFGIYLADAVGYTGSVALQLGKDLGLGGGQQLVFLKGVCYALSVLGVIGLVVSCTALLRRPRA
ncbi:MAG: DUF5690 family protein [Lacipirellulaceae bacterium]